MMSDKGSLNVITTEESQISSYGIEFDSKSIEEKHVNYLIKFIFTDRRLCAIFGKYSQRDYARMNEKELRDPLVKFGFGVVVGISDALLIYLPQNLDLKQSNEFNTLLLKQKDTDVERIYFSQLNDKNEFVNMDYPMTIEQALDYVNNLASIEVDTMRRKLK